VKLSKGTERKPNPQTELNEVGYSTGKWSDDDDIHPTITPLFGPNR
jgi:hypothetical protein